MNHMIKIRGHKVFPKDIESVLRTAPGVKEICVIDYTPPEDARRLVGYLEIDPAEFPGIETLHKRIDHLPNYMKPQNWVFVDEMPLNASRKIDRSRLQHQNNHGSMSAQNLNRPAIRLKNHWLPSGLKFLGLMESASMTALWNLVGILSYPHG